MQLVRKSFALVLVAPLSFANLAAQELRAGAVKVSAPWARATPGGATNGAAYLTLSVESAAGDRLVKAASPRAERVELHATVETQGVMRMMPQEAVEIAPGGTVAFKPGGLHIMLMGLKSPLAAGDTLPLALTFARAGTVEIAVPVLPLAAQGPESLMALPDPHAGH